MCVEEHQESLSSKKALDFDDVEDFMSGKAVFRQTEETVSEEILALSSGAMAAPSTPMPTASTIASSGLQSELGASVKGGKGGGGKGGKSIKKWNRHEKIAREVSSWLCTMDLLKGERDAARCAIDSAMEYVRLDQQGPELDSQKTYASHLRIFKGRKKVFDLIEDATKKIQ